MTIEDRLARLEATNGRLRLAVTFLSVLVVAIPLMSALQDEAPSKVVETERLVIAGKDGWKMVLGTHAAKDRGGFGAFLLDEKGVARARMVLDGTSPRIDVSSAKGNHGAALVAESKDASALGVWKDDHWGVRSEVAYGRPNSLVYDDEGNIRLRYGMYKGDAYYALVDVDGKTDRVWMMLESTGRCSVSVRAEKLAQVSLSADKEEPVGVSVRDVKGRLRALMYTHEDASHVAVYGANENSRVDMRVKKSDTGVEVVDATDKPRVNLGVDDKNVGRLQIRDPEGKTIFKSPPK